jgi:hypothetical protein
MKIKVFHPNAIGRIEFTRAELEKLLNEVYEEGRKDCERTQPYTWSPYIYSTPTYRDTLTSTSSGITLTNHENPAPINDLTCNCKSESEDGKAICVSTSCSSKSNEENKAQTLTTNKNAPYTYTVNFDATDISSLHKAVNDIIAQASRGARPSTKTMDSFDALAKELNF